jgi:hypothetical protein
LIQNVEIFIGIAHIAGIFIGFAALISIIRRDEIEHFKLSRIRAVVQIGLLVVIGALIPIGFDLYGASGHILWFICSFIFLALNWLMGLLSILNPENREAMIAQMRNSPLKSILFWLLFEFPLQASLILIIIGLFPDIEHALYTTALFFNLFEAVYTLVQLVYSQGSSSKT